MSARLRLTGFVIVGLLLAMLAGWAGRTTWRGMHELRHGYAAMEGDAFHLSEYIEASLRDLHEMVLRFGARQNPSDRARFLAKGNELRQWIKAHKTLLTTPEAGEIMQKIDAAFDLYFSQSITLMEQLAQPDAVPSGTQFLDSAERTAAPVLALCRELTGIERVALDGFLKESYQSLWWLQRLLIVLFLLLLASVAVLGTSFYRELVVPLRSQLRRSHAIIERHEKLASLGTLAAGVAHEVRNPLTAINVRLHSLKRCLVTGSSEHDDATVIESEIRRLEAIVQEFLLFARPSEPTFLTVSADSLLVKVRRLMSGQLEKASIQLHLDSPPDIWVRVDPQQVEQVLINLVQNAAESIERDGTIRLSARTDTTRLGGQSRPVAVIGVSDNGKGIPPEVQKRLFDPFFTTKQNGTGLGLSIAARIVEQQGGTLHFTTTLKRGTTFYVVLPQAQSQDERSSSPLDH